MQRGRQVAYNLIQAQADSGSNNNEFDNGVERHG